MERLFVLLSIPTILGAAGTFLTVVAGRYTARPERPGPRYSRTY